MVNCLALRDRQTSINKFHMIAAFHKYLHTILLLDYVDNPINVRCFDWFGFISLCSIFHISYYACMSFFCCSFIAKAVYQFRYFMSTSIIEAHFQNRFTYLHFSLWNNSRIFINIYINAFINEKVVFKLSQKIYIFHVIT